MDIINDDDLFNDDMDLNQNTTVHIWLKQRTGRKYYTEIENLPRDLNLQKIIKYWKHMFHCSVSIINNETNNETGKNTTNGNKTVRLQGDQRDNIYNFLINENIVNKINIKVHGF